MINESWNIESYFENNMYNINWISKKIIISKSYSLFVSSPHGVCWITKFENKGLFYILTFHKECNYISLPKIPASGDKVLLYDTK